MTRPPRKPIKDQARIEALIDRKITRLLEQLVEHAPNGAVGPGVKLTTGTIDEVLAARKRRRS